MLTQEQLDFYNENGYVHVKGLLTREEAEMYCKEEHEVINRLRAIKDVEATWKSAAEAAMTMEKDRRWEVPAMVTLKQRETV